MEPRSDQYPVAVAAEAPGSRFVAALVGGALVAVLSAAVWGAITYFTNYQLGLIAIGVGLAVGLTVRILGRGRTVVFGLLGAVLSLLGIVLGNIFFISAAIAREEALPALEVLAVLLGTPDLLAEILVETFEVIDLAFYGLALYVGFRTAFGAAPEAAAPTQPPLGPG
jgi:hypothetical protein